MFGRSIKLIRIMGIAIELDLSWFIIFLLVAWSLSMGYFPHYYPGIRTGNYWMMGFSASLLLFISVLLHELSHSIVAIRNKLPITRITLFIFGGVANMGEEPHSPGVEFRVAVAGPLCSLFLMFIFNAASLLFSEGEEIYAILRYTGYINGFLAAFNLIPGFPLDGGRILRSAIWHFTGDYKKATGAATSVGRGFAFFLMATGFLEVIRGSGFNGLWLIMIGYFIKNAADSSLRQVQIKEIINDIDVEKVMNRRIIHVEEGLLLSSLVEDYFLPYHVENFPVLDSGVLKGIVSMRGVKNVPKEMWSAVTVKEIMDINTDRYTLSPKDSIEAVLLRMVGDDRGWFIVISENGEAVGIITRSDIMHLLKIKSDLDE